MRATSIFTLLAGAANGLQVDFSDDGKGPSYDSTSREANLSQIRSNKQQAQ